MEPKRAVLFLLTTMIALCSGLPANLKEDVEPVTPSKTYGDQPIVDTGIFGGWENPFKSNPFGGLFDNLEGIMERMRQQISSLINSFPSISSNSTEDISPFPTGFEHPVFPVLPGIDLSKGNTSSITKVIDGHTVVINETEYKNEDDFGGTFFKVRIIDVKPDSEVTTEKEAEAVSESSTSKDREEIANSMENEIFKSKEADVTDNPEHQVNGTEKPSDDQYANLETFDEDANSLDIYNGSSLLSNETVTSIPEHTTRHTEWDEDRNDSENPEWNFVEPVDTVDSNNLDVKEFAENERNALSDLSRDTYVNQLLAERGSPTDPDAEILVFEDDKLSPFAGKDLPLDTRK